MIENSESNKVHIVILTWNNNKILKRCLESIENAHGLPNECYLDGPYNKIERKKIGNTQKIK